MTPLYLPIREKVGNFELMSEWNQERKMKNLLVGWSRELNPGYVVIMIRFKLWILNENKKEWLLRLDTVRKPL